MTRVATPPAKQPQVTPKPQVAVHSQGGPTQEQIAKRAYEKWIKRGRCDGNHVKDWLEAEVELKKEMIAGNVRR